MPDLRACAAMAALPMQKREQLVEDVWHVPLAAGRPACRGKEKQVGRRMREEDLCHRP